MSGNVMDSLFDITHIMCFFLSSPCFMVWFLVSFLVLYMSTNQILNRRFKNNWINAPFGIGSCKKVNKLCSFFQFGLK